MLDWLLHHCEVISVNGPSRHGSPLRPSSANRVGRQR
ncbi:hypothetical protein OG496_09845 [Streptomyces sp. NBC_00988]|nr:hypothetical protein OG496_09845 [Streptomyces sp. NBC_00988]